MNPSDGQPRTASEQFSHRHGNACRASAGRPPGASPAVISVVDTRQWVEGADDRWRAIAGSGDARPCDRCGSLHEIHVTVQESGRQHVVGLGCAQAESMFDQAAVRTITSAIKTARRIEHQLVAMRIEHDYQQSIRDQVNSMTPPSEIVKVRSSRFNGKSEEWRYKDVRAAGVFVIAHDDGDMVERLECLQDNWRRHQIVLLGGDQFDQSADKIIDLEKRKKRANMKVDALLKAAQQPTI